jgi:Transposase DNA-binding
MVLGGVRRCVMADWIAEEMAGLDLGDRRLNARQCLLLERFSAHPQGSIPESQKGWAETQAAYRFFDNEQVTAESVLAPHRQATLERIRQNDVVLVLQDTTEVELDRSPEGGFGKLTYENRIGLMDHTQLADRHRQCSQEILDRRRRPQPGPDPAPTDRKRQTEGLRRPCRAVVRCPDSHPGAPEAPDVPGTPLTPKSSLPRQSLRDGIRFAKDYENTASSTGC